MAPAGSLVGATRPSGSPRLSSRCLSGRSANALGGPRTANLTPVERRDFGPGRTLIAESTWDWMLLREAGGALVLSVVCGTVGLYEVEVVLGAESLAAYASEGLGFIERLAADVRDHPGDYLSAAPASP